MTAKQLHFQYQSIENFVHLLATIRFENTHDADDIAIWHERFDDEDGDSLFGTFLVELFPEGKTIQPEDIDIIMNRAERFLEKDDKTRQIKNARVKRHSPYWVHFKIDDIVYPCEFCEHTRTITDICVDFFRSFDDLSPEYLQKFILEHFEIKSDNSTVQRIARDAEFMCREILFRNRKR